MASSGTLRTLGSLRIRHRGLANRIQKVLRIVLIEPQLARHLQRPSRIGLRRSSRQLNANDPRNIRHLAKPAADGMFNEKEARSLQVFAERLHVTVQNDG